MSDKLVIGENIFDNILVAVTESEQSNGLMYKQWPPPVMIFPYKNAGFRKFWMKNTISPLDIIFCKDDIITGMFKGEPLSTCAVGPETQSDLVIELPFGTAKKLGIGVGDKVSIEYSLKTIIKRFSSGV